MNDEVMMGGGERRERWPLRRRGAVAVVTRSVRRKGLGVLMVALFGLGVAVEVGCYSPERYAELRAERAVDIDEEMDILFECAVDVVREAEGVEHSSEVTRRVRGDWTMDDSEDPVERRQVVLQVIVDPAMGPGVVARHVRQRWQGAGEPAIDARGLPDGHDAGASGWVLTAVRPEDRERERRLVDATRSCWSVQSRHGGRRN